MSLLLSQEAGKAIKRGSSTPAACQPVSLATKPTPSSGLHGFPLTHSTSSSGCAQVAGFLWASGEDDFALQVLVKIAVRALGSWCLSSFSLSLHSWL